MPAGVAAICTTRHGGGSRPPFDELNLGEHVGDDPLAVAANRLQLQRELGARAVFLNQVHGTAVVDLDASSPNGLQADACLTRVPLVACTVMVADCLPVLICSAQGDYVGAAHAGWRGLAQGVLEQTLAAFWQRQTNPGLAPDRASSGLAQQTLVWLGPCIGPQAFEVGPEVRAAFLAQQPGCESHFVACGAGKYLADLAALARQRLHAMGVSQIYGNDSGPSWCTVRNASNFFSHRRDRVSGRLAACIWRT